MPMPALNAEVYKEVIERVNQAIREGASPPDSGYPGKSALRQAATKAIEDGFVKSESTFNTRYRKALESGLSIDEGLYTPPVYAQPTPKANIAPALAPDRHAVSPSGKHLKVMVIGDLHQDPRHPDRLEVMKWLARHGSARKYTHVIQIGDWGSFDSCSSYDKNDSAKGRLKPTIGQDLDNLADSLAMWHRHKDADWKPRQYVTLGNHENRIWHFQNRQPETGTTFTDLMQQHFAQFGWHTKLFGEIMFLEGVGFTHHPTNGMGRAFGGKTGIVRASNEASCSLVSGHSHNLKLFSQPKIGLTAGIEHVEVGCGLPWGVVEDYAKHSPVNWWWGCVELTIGDGRIYGMKSFPMWELERDYG